jgi:hypothetical protein
MKPVQMDTSEIQKILANRIASLELQLATEQAARQAIIKYAEELEKKLEKYEKMENAKK